jgi:hypothetical protein
MQTAKQIEAMPYGSPQQLQAASHWLERFEQFAESHPLAAEAVWHRLFSQDVWYIARRNRNLA